MSDVGFWSIRLTIWLAVAAWFGRVWIEASRREFAGRVRCVRVIWWIGGLSCAAHVVVAMGFAHCWSLTNAMRHTAMVTRQVMGVELPFSIFANFAFTGYWLIDAWREVRQPVATTLGPARHSIWGVMMINGTVVFGPRYWIWIATSLGLILAVTHWGSRVATQSVGPSTRD